MSLEEELKNENEQMIERSYVWTIVFFYFIYVIISFLLGLITQQDTHFFFIRFLFIYVIDTFHIVALLIRVMSSMKVTDLHYIFFFKEFFIIFVSSYFIVTNYKNEITWWATSITFFVFSCCVYYFDKSVKKKGPKFDLVLSETAFSLEIRLLFALNLIL